MGFRAAKTAYDLGTNPETQYTSGYKIGHVGRLPYGLAVGGTYAGSFVPAIAQGLGYNNDAITVASALADTAGETLMNWTVGVPNQRNMAYAGSNLLGNLGGVYALRHLTGTQDDSNGIVDTVGMIGGEAITDTLTDMYFGDLKMKDIPSNVWNAIPTKMPSWNDIASKYKQSNDQMKEYMNEGMKQGRADKKAGVYNPSAGYAAYTDFSEAPTVVPEVMGLGSSTVNTSPTYPSREEFVSNVSPARPLIADFIPDTNPAYPARPKRVHEMLDPEISHAMADALDNINSDKTITINADTLDNMIQKESSAIQGIDDSLKRSRIWSDPETGKLFIERYIAPTLHKII